MKPIESPQSSFRAPSDPPSGVRRRTRGGDPLRDALSVLASERLKKIEGIARRLGVPEADAEDLLQDTLEDLWKHRHDVEPPRWRGWLRTALVKRRNEGTRNWRTAKAYEPEIAHREQCRHEAALTPEEVASGREWDRDVAAVIARLSPERREVASLYFLDRAPLTEIAERLQLPYEAVRSRWRHALEEMESVRERDREKERSRRVWLALRSSAGAFLLAFWRRLLGRDRRRDRTGTALGDRAGAVLACASLTFLLVCHRGLPPMQRADAAFSSVFGAVASVQGLLPRSEAAEVEPPPPLAATSVTRAPPPSVPDDEVSSAGRSPSRPGIAPSRVREEGSAKDALLRLAIVTSKSDPDRAVRLLREHARRFGPIHAATRQEILAKITAVRPAAIAAPVKER